MVRALAHKRISYFCFYLGWIRPLRLSPFFPRQLNLDSYFDSACTLIQKAGQGLPAQYPER